MNINKENINKEIYFLDNYEYTDREGVHILMKKIK